MTLKQSLSYKSSSSLPDTPLSSPDAPSSLPGLSGQSTVITKSVFALSIFCLTFLFGLITGSIILTPYASDATTTSTSVDVIVDVGSVLSIRATPTLVDLSLTPTPSGTEVHRELTITVNTNNSTGYTLSMNTESNNTALVHTNATNEIPSTSSPTPASLPVNRWGYNMGTGATTFLRIPPLNDSDTINSSSGPVIDHDTIITLGTKIDSGSMAGLYSNILVFTATTNYVPPSGPCGTGDYECIIFTINTTDGTYSIPTSGRVANMDHTYDWDVYVDGILTTDCPSGNCTGTGSHDNTPGVHGIALTGLSSGQHQIKILPHGSPSPGWGNAFGHGGWGTSNSLSNRNKVISIDAPLTTMAFAPKTSESTTNAERMFENTLVGCSNLTTPATFKDTYKLPNTVTNLSRFLSFFHAYSESLTAPMDLSGLAGWLNKNNSITDLSFFMIGTQYDNFYTNPIDLTPLSGWFNANNSITNMHMFLFEIHSQNPNLTHPLDLTPLSDWFVANNSITDLSDAIGEIHNENYAMTEPIDLTPLSGWFNNNTSITELYNFMNYTHFDNTNLTTPIDLTPLSGWFNANTSVTNLSAFLSGPHASNPELTTPIDLTPLAGWFNANTSIANLAYLLSYAHSDNPKLQTPIDLTPLAGWFSNNNSITNLSRFLQNTHQNNPILSAPINLAPLSGWFSNNTSISDVYSFLGDTHSGNTSLTVPIDLTPLSGWFSSNRSFTELRRFLYQTHMNNPNLTLSSQIIFPNWIKTATQGAAFIWNGSNTFYRMFYTSSTKNGDTGEPRFSDGTPLSRIGAPNTNLQTYTNRSGITPENSNWK